LWFEGLPAGMFDAIYFWDESDNQYAEYVNGIQNNGGWPIVPPTQGFFFELDGSLSTVDIQFSPTQQLHNEFDVFPFWKNEITDLVRLEVAANGYTDQATIRFNEQATAERDGTYDARKLKSGGITNPNLYTMGSELALAINQLPAVDMVPVYFECQTSGSYTISAVETSEFQHVVLEDLSNGIQTDLLTNDYTFEYVEGEDADRFMLHFTPLGTPELEANSIRIWASDHNIYVSVPETINGEIAVFNMMGQQVISSDADPGLNILPVSDVNTYYVVKVLTANTAKTGKVFVK
jgi:hypothetical protein